MLLKCFQCYIFLPKQWIHYVLFFFLTFTLHTERFIHSDVPICTVWRPSSAALYAEVFHPGVCRQPVEFGDRQPAADLHTQLGVPICGSDAPIKIQLDFNKMSVWDTCSSQAAEEVPLDGRTDWYTRVNVSSVCMIWDVVSAKCFSLKLTFLKDTRNFGL